LPISASSGRGARTCAGKVPASRGAPTLCVGWSRIWTKKPGRNDREPACLAGLKIFKNYLPLLAGQGLAAPLQNLLGNPAAAYVQLAAVDVVAFGAQEECQRVDQILVLREPAGRRTDRLDHAVFHDADADGVHRDALFRHGR